MSKRTILTIVYFILVSMFILISHQAFAQAQDRLVERVSFWKQAWDYLSERPIIFSIIIVTFVTIFSTIMTMLKKDKLLKSLAGHLVTIELKDGGRHRGRLRVESEGLEVVAEKVNQSNEKVSYLLRQDEFNNIHALVRYHDFLTEREKEARRAEVDQVYHPSIGMRLRRRFRNFINTMKRVASKTFKLVFGTVKKQFKGEAGQYAGELEKSGQEAISYVTEAAYDTLIDRLIGTKVVVRVVRDNKNVEYVGVLKDYTGQFIELMDVSYKNEWSISMDRGHPSKHERGLIVRKDGNDVVIRSKSPFPVTLRHIYWTGDRPDTKRENINKVIEPFGELRLNTMPPTLEITVNPFEQLRLPTNYHYQEYKNMRIAFESVRVADIVMLKNYGIVRHRTEKYEPRLLDFGALADALLTDKAENLAVEGNPAASALSIYNGYITNLPRERMDVAAVDQQINERWTVKNFFNITDKKLRPIKNLLFLGFLPLWRARKVMGMFTLIRLIHDKKNKEDAKLLPFIYSTLCRISSKKRCKTYKKQVLIKKKKRILGFIPRPSQI
ncbi:hypothetical protein GF312_18005 [Candidatus Poribacteria bacterium]|nr:hypothetical protein [Candidatus Poribacteria bacterium]